MPTPQEILHAVQQVRGQQSFICGFLRDTLGWQIPEEAEDMGDIAYAWSVDELNARGLDEKVAGGHVWQIQPLSAEIAQSWGIFVLDFVQDDAFVTGRGLTGPLRGVLRGLVPKRRGQQANRKTWERENLLFICTHKYKHFRFAYFKAPKGKEKTAPLVQFGWNESDADVRTLCEHNLPHLAWDLDDPDMDHWREAFSVEKVTKSFYGNYRDTFVAVEKIIGQNNKAISGDDLRLFTQTLFNRLMFLRFIEKKGWLRFKGDTTYLAALYAAGGIKGRSFYRSRLQPLFFEALAIEDKQKSDAAGDVVFLNGGLFEKKLELDEKVSDIPDEAFEDILGREGLFYRFNFTVQESTPLDIEVAVDPEMLGKVFEELVTGRHETGSYYTPRPVVAFMCREAIKGFLAAKTSASREAIAELVDEHEIAEDLTDRHAEEILFYLETIKAIDPACGSGAYLLGLLQELIGVRRTLQHPQLGTDSGFLFQLKLRLISQSLYGVDIDPFATNIAKLRLWLSLAVEAETAQPLPNLDFKIETGDSILGPCDAFMDGPDALVLSALRTRAQELVLEKDRYMTAHGEEKTRLYEHIRKEEAVIAEDTETAIGENVIAWHVHFGDVFGRCRRQLAITKTSEDLKYLKSITCDPGGFDIVLANPPYVRADAQFKHVVGKESRQNAIAKWKVYRKQVKASGFFKTLHEKWDMYIPFLERAHQLLTVEGHMVFIISDAYNAAKYTQKSHEFFLGHACIERLDFCSDIPLFDAGVFNTVVHFSKATPTPDHIPLRVYRWGQTKEDFAANLELLPSAAQVDLGRTAFRPDGAQQDVCGETVPLDMICYISYGLRANADDRHWQGEFTTEDCLSSTRDRIHPKLFAQGKDLGRWVVRTPRYLEWGTDRAPAKFSRPTFCELHEADEKLVAARSPGSEPRAVYDRDNLHFDASSVGFVPWHLLEGVVNRSITKTAKYRRQSPDGDRDEREAVSRQFHLKYILAILNSAFAREWLAARRRSRTHVYPDDWKGLPIVPLSEENQRHYVNLVDAILNEFSEHGYPLPGAAAVRVAEFEREIDERVAGLYGSRVEAD